MKEEQAFVCPGNTKEGCSGGRNVWAHMGVVLESHGLFRAQREVQGGWSETAWVAERGGKQGRESEIILQMSLYTEQEGWGFIL